MSTLSVVIPTYNRCDILGRAIDSVLRQEGADFELIVVDDGSEDGTSDLLALYEDPRLVVVSQPNAGVCAARNAGVRASTGDYLVWLDSDDEALPGWLRFHANAHADGIEMASSAARLVWPDGREELVTPSSRRPTPGGTHSVMLAGAIGIRRDLLLEVGGFRDGLRFSEHTDLALRLRRRMLSNAFLTRWTDEPLVTLYRVPSAYDPAVQYESAMYILEQHREHLSPRLTSIYMGIAAVAAGKLGRRKEAISLLSQAIRANPMAAKNYLRLVWAAFSKNH